MRVTLTVPVDPHDTSANQRLHWAERARRVGKARMAAYLAWLQAGQPQLPSPVTLSVHVRRGRVLDQDGVWSGLKGCIDVLCQSFNRKRTGRPDGMIEDDGPAHLILGAVTQETGKRWATCPHVEMTFEHEEGDGG